METLHRILVICEDPSILDRLGKHLCEQHFDVRCATSGTEALADQGDWIPELVVCDDHLGGVRGLDLIEALHQRHQQTRFILITPPGETPEFIHFQPKRIVVFLSKPFNPEDLMHYVRRALDLSDGMGNRREHSRYPFTIETHISLINPFDSSESRPIAGLMRDISRSGVSMIVRQLLPVPSMLKFVFLLPQQQHPVNMLAKSMSCMLTQIPGVYRLGAKFIGLLPAEVVDGILEMNAHAGQVSQEDIFMGKSFKEAAREWLAEHHQDFNNLSLETTPNVAEMAAEVSRDPRDETMIKVKQPLAG
jgi:CheY-like chemotaxis protein